MADFTTEWYTGLDEGRYATWVAAGWGPVFLSGVAKNSSGKWRASDLPQKDANAFVTSNWGGSTLAVMKTTQHPAEAAEPPFQSRQVERVRERAEAPAQKIETFGRG